MSSTLELSEYEKYVQMYSTEMIDKDFCIKDFPRDSVREVERLKRLGIFFLRDAEDFIPIFGENRKDPIKCYYTQLVLNSDGSVEGFQLFNQPTMIDWIDDGKVKRKFL